MRETYAKTVTTEGDDSFKVTVCQVRQQGQEWGNSTEEVASERIGGWEFQAD